MEQEQGMTFSAFTLLPNLERSSIKENSIAWGILMALRTARCNKWEGLEKIQVEQSERQKWQAKQNNNNACELFKFQEDGKEWDYGKVKGESKRLFVGLLLEI